MSKVTLGAALVLTTATVATSVVVNPSVVKADDYVVADKNAEIYTIYDISGYGNVSWYDIFDENGVLYPDLAKLRDYEYTTVSKDGIWSVGPNGEKNWDPNAVKPEPTTPSTTEPATQTTPSTEVTPPSTSETTPSTSETTTATSEKPEDVTKLSTQTTTTTPTKATEEIETLPKTGDASILSMLAGTGILSGLGLTSLKRKLKK